MWSSFLCHPPSVFYFIVVTLRVYFISSWSQVEAGTVVSYPCRPVSLRSLVLWSPAGRTLPPAAQILPADPSSQRRPEPVYSGRGRHTAPSSNWENREEETTDDAWTHETHDIQLWASIVCFYFGRNVWRWVGRMFLVPYFFSEKYRKHVQQTCKWPTLLSHKLSIWADLLWVSSFFGNFNVSSWRPCWCCWRLRRHEERQWPKPLNYKNRWKTSTKNLTFVKEEAVKRSNKIWKV